MKKIAVLLLAVLSLSCSKSSKEDTPKTPEQMIVGEWRKTHRAIIPLENTNNLVTFIPIFGQARIGKDYFTIDGTGMMSMFDRDILPHPVTDEIAAKGMYSFQNGKLEFDVKLYQLAFMFSLKYDVLYLTEKELIIKMYYFSVGDAGSHLSYVKYYRYSRISPSASDAPFDFNLSTNKKG